MRWGSCEPQKEGWYLVTLTNGTVMPLYRVNYPDGNYWWKGAMRSEVIAAIKFPKPFKMVIKK